MKITQSIINELRVISERAKDAHPGMRAWVDFEFASRNHLKDLCDAMEEAMNVLMDIAVAAS